MQKYDLLSDRANAFVNLINCEVFEDNVKCSIAWFLGGISGTIELFSESNYICSVLIPEYVLESATFVLKINELDKINVKRQ